MGMRKLLNIFKDNASLIKASLAAKRDNYIIQKAIIHATAQATTSPPPEYRIATILNLGQDTRQVARACIESIINRLHNTENPCVKLKCLIIIHNIIFKGSFILKDQLAIFSLSNCTPILPILQKTSVSSNSGYVLEDSADDTDNDSSTLNHHMGQLQNRSSERNNPGTWELWQWVGWYTAVLERNLNSSIRLGCYFFSSSTYTEFDKFKDADYMNQSHEKDLYKDLGVLVCFIEEICEMPEFRECSLVNEIVKLVSQEYGCLQHQIMMRLNEFRQRLERLSSAELSELMSYLKRLKTCKKILNRLFEDRKGDKSFWELFNQTKMEIDQLEERREKEMKRVELEKRREKERKEYEKKMEEEMKPPPILLLLPPHEDNNQETLVEVTHSVGRVNRASRNLWLFPCFGCHDVAVDRVH